MVEWVWIGFEGIFKIISFSKNYLEITSVFPLYERKEIRLKPWLYEPAVHEAAFYLQQLISMNSKFDFC